MSNICIITMENRRLYPAQVYETKDNQLEVPLLSIDAIYNLLYKRESILVLANQYDQMGMKLENFNGHLEKSDIKAIFMINDEENIRKINEVMTLSEAAKKWGLSDGSTIRKAIERGKFEQDEIKQAGDVWITTYSAMEKVFGNVKSEENEFIIYDDLESCIYKLYNKDGALDYLKDEELERRTKENDHLYQYIKGVFVRALDAIKKGRKVIIKNSRNNKIKQIMCTEKEFFSYIELLPHLRMMSMKRNEQLIDELKNSK
ncbi:helix-turn-helix domain-containing protein [Clostridium sp. 'White wine YQ']|uniref:helix-turn-helix domain-containing protein n=1 Tax=Clostridium sp. 'White wine YQ' TaxID=3027474 RepID=UPI0023670243|nr:helix-turn-helix domain-containing protein [Clostridium sp. 'White wine YQ']MDD7793558.1 helix-turn-helix domain-containing protein [Clostridium sp. 'White wine YQ']